MLARCMLALVRHNNMDDGWAYRADQSGLPALCVLLRGDKHDRVSRVYGRVSEECDGNLVAYAGMHTIDSTLETALEQEIVVLSVYMLQTRDNSFLQTFHLCHALLAL